MNYEAASDESLELKLCKLLNVHNDDESFFDNENLINCRPRYCSDWNSVMPLAVEHGVCLLPYPDDDGNYSAIAGVSYWSGMSFQGINPEVHMEFNFSAFDKNPLRAIVICLIKVLEAKNES